MAMREGPINVAAGKVLVDTGQYLALSSYGPALDHLLRSMSRMAKAFSEPADIFITTVQLLRALAAPGLGKSTFVRSAWSMLLQRIKAVQGDDEVRWRNWQALGADDLLMRLESSWQTSFGPLVYTVDMSDGGEWTVGFGVLALVWVTPPPGPLMLLHALDCFPTPAMAWGHAFPTF
jgi:hypothetical protein